MSFCRITGKARALPKANYFPLLPPISPGAASRFCRITGKSYGLPTHHFIPVSLSSFSSKKKCKVTNVSLELGKHHYAPDILYGKRKHIVLLDYRYVIPVLDIDCEAQKELFDIFNDKSPENENNFVYRVDEKRCNLVFPARFEAAVRDGDIQDIMFAKDTDQILLRMRKGNNVSVDLHTFKESLDILYEGEGPKEEVLVERETKIQEEKRTRKISKCKKQLSNMTKLFEYKENFEDENEVKKKSQIKKKPKISKNLPTNLAKKDLEIVKTQMELIVEEKKMFQDLVKPLLESWDWDTYEKEVGQITSAKSVLTKNMKVEEIKASKVKALIKLIEKFKLENTVGFESIPLVGCYKPPDLKALVKSIKDYQKASPEMMKKLENVVEKFMDAGYETSYLLPTEDELFEVLQNISKGNKSELNGVPGYQIDIEERKIFLPGEFIVMESGKEIFIPGQAVKGDDGKSTFVPGLTTINSKGVSFIPGQVMTSKDSQVHFQAGQISNDEFHCGQTVYVNDEPKFVEGQTIITPEGIRFVAGVVNEDNELIPGQVLVMPNGEQKFIAGQMTEIFVAGQNVQVGENEWKFVPGQTVVDDQGVEIFVAGQTVVNEEGSKFIAGMYINDVFVPGVTRKVDNELKFIPGISIETKQGTQFVEGQIVMSSLHGEIFMPGTTEFTPDGEPIFKIAKGIDEITFAKPLPSGMVIDSHSLDVHEASLSVFGNMVQTENGIEFYPGKIDENALPYGKMIPGKLIKQGLETKFVPGVMGSSDEGFIPGQIVVTDRGEEFVAGQLIETKNGPKFVPGQVIETKNGELKFVPGQTIVDEQGNSRFVPGQIIDTTCGPTFIPGQIVYTEEDGERFVPGQVVETSMGMCFVPGRIVETDGKVTFVPGQVVETPEGLRFVAHDMEDGDGDFEYSLQGFQVTPEELALIKPKNTWSTTNAAPGELSIDAAMLRQLSEAGMSVGRQVESTGVDLVLQSTINQEIVGKFAEAHSISLDVADSIFKMIKMLTDEHKGKINPDNLTESILELCMSMNSNVEQNGQSSNDTVKTSGKKTRKSGVVNVGKDATQALETNQIVNILTKVMIDILKNEDHCIIDGDGSLNNIISAASHHANVLNGNGKSKNESIYDIIANVLNETVHNLNIEQLQQTFSSPNAKLLVLEKLSNTINKVETLCKIEEMKQNLLSSLSGGDVSNGHAKNKKKNKKGCNIEIMVNDNHEVMEQFCDIIDDLEISSAFSVMSKNNPKMMLEVLNAIQCSTNPNITMKEIIQSAIIKAVNAESDNKIDELFATDDKQSIDKVLNEALVLAKVLGLNSEAMAIISALDSSSKSSDKIVLDEATKSLIRRVCVMKQLAEADPDYQEALEMLHQSPHRAVKDEIVRELVRKSGLISIQLPDKQTIESSKDIPLSLLVNDNILAMEDFMLRSGTSSKAFLIIKDGMQCVIPREKSHDVLTGKCAYTVLDENGIRNFEPMHVMSALKLNTASQHHRFSIYADDAMDELGKLRRSSCSPTYDNHAAKDFKFLNCEIINENGESENGDSEPSIIDSEYEHDVNETGYRRPRRRRLNDKSNPENNLDYSTTMLLNKKRGKKQEAPKPAVMSTVYRQYKQINQNIYIMHAFVLHSKDRKQRN